MKNSYRRQFLLNENVKSSCKFYADKEQLLKCSFSGYFYKLD